jgi:hypothetical protein
MKGSVKNRRNYKRNIVRILELEVVVGEGKVVASESSGVEENNKGGMLSEMIKLSSNFENQFERSKEIKYNTI